MAEPSERSVNTARAEPVLAASGATGLAASGALARIGRYRWTICALLFFATTINYIDRQVLGILGPTLQHDLGWNEQQYADVVSWFTIAYAIGYLAAGRIMDRIGTRRGFAASIAVWSVSAMAHAVAFTTAGFSAARFALGLGESGNFPASIKTVAEWFPPRERALATGIFNAGSNIGAIVTPIVVPWIALTWGWRASFIVTGALGFLWLAAWLGIYRPPAEHPKCGAAELAHITSGEPEESRSIKWLRLLRYRETWAFAIGKFLTDPIWWFYLFWLPRYLQQTFGLSLSQNRLPLVIVYVVSTVGSIGGGWISSTLLRAGKTTNVSRKTAMLICALCVVPVFAAPYIHHLWVVVGLVGLATAAHQGWSANLFTLPSDMFPKAAVGSVIGIGGMAGALGGVLLQVATGYIVKLTNSYVPLFVIACLAYIVALLIIHGITPRLAPAQIES